MVLDTSWQESPFALVPSASSRRWRIDATSWGSPLEKPRITTVRGEISPASTTLKSAFAQATDRFLFFYRECLIHSPTSSQCR